MTIKTALRAHLIADAPVFALVGARIHFAGQVPQGTGLPHVTLQQITRPSHAHLGGESDAESPDYQVTVWASKQSELDPVVVAVIDALDITHGLLGAVDNCTVRRGSFPGGIESPNDGSEAAKIFSPIPFTIWHSRTAAA